jgi:FG-GAP-like repeat/Cep192 domain 4/FG-GAP repeat
MHLRKTLLATLVVLTMISFAGNLTGVYAQAVPPVSFNAPVDYTVGTLPFANAVADFNGDKILDITVCNYSSNNVSVLLGNGDGTFQPAVNYTVGTEPSAITVGDFNGDGAPDIAVADEIGKTIAILINKADGSGTFKPAVLYAAGQAPRGIVAGSLRNNGILDLVVANNLGGDVTVFLGNGDGTFQAGVNYTADQNPKSVTLGVFSSNGVLDIAVANHNTNDVSILMGNGDGTFQAPVNYPVGLDPRHVLAFDFNKDGKLDLATANGGESTVSILYGNGDGTFQPQVKYNASTSPRWLAVADYNNDGELDIATSNYDAKDVSVLLGTGSSTAGQAFLAPTNYIVGNNPTGLVAGDFNGDGLPDIAVTIGGLPTKPNTVMAVLLNNPVSVSPTTITFPTQVLQTASAGRLVTLTNGSPNSLSISSISFTGANPGDFSQTNNCGSSLSAKASCNISVKFTPTNINTRTASLTISDNAGTQTVAIKGVGTAVSLSPKSLTFAAQTVGTTSPAQTITLTDVSGTALSITGISITGANATDFAQNNTCGTGINGKANCTISVTFTPAATGTRKAAVSIADNGGGSPQTVALTGTGK